MTPSTKDRAAKKVEIAIDKMVDLQDLGFGCDTVSRVLELLRQLEAKVHAAPVTHR